MELTWLRYSLPIAVRILSDTVVFKYNRKITSDL